MDSFANKSETDKQAYIELAANRKGLSEQIIEKDFWVCWTLSKLFSLPNIKDYLIFKGGTSLSKAYSLIDRFSEDIDISIDKNFLGFSADNDPENASSNKKQQMLIKNLSYACKEFVQKELKEQLNEVFIDSLKNTTTPWSLEVDPIDVDEQSLLFFYPRANAKKTLGYIRPTIKVEFGSRGGREPTNNSIITPFIEELIPGTLSKPNSPIKTLAAERTFWEKATILHMFSHWPDGKQIPERQSRHFFDFFKLLESDVKYFAANDPNLLLQVSKHKKIYFRAGWADYNNAIQGSLCLTPKESILKIFESDYKKMEEMFYDAKPEWEKIISSIKKFESEFNEKG